MLVPASTKKGPLSLKPGLGLEADESAEAIEKEFAALNALASQNDPEDDERLQIIVREIREKERELARRRAGLE